MPVSATNAYGTSTGTLTITVFANATAAAAVNGVTVPLITSPAAAGGYTNQSFSYQVVATYGGSPYLTPSGTWTFSASGLPPGLSLSSTSAPYGYAGITGTPTVVGTYSATISATVAASPYYPPQPAATTTATVTFIIQAGPAVIVPAILNNASFSAIVGTACTFYSSAANSPTGFAASGLPPGLSINASSGTISGTPTTAGTYQMTFSATNSAGTGSATIECVVSPLGVPLITSVAAAYGSVGTAFTYTVATTPASASFGAANLPPGLSCNATSGVISGTPTAAGIYSVPLSATNAAGAGNATLTITIAATAVSPVPLVTSDAEAQATVGTSFYYYIDASVSVTSYAAGTLPAGLTFNATYGEITGTPTAAGIFTVPISASNSAGTGSATLTVAVAPLPAPTLSGSAVVNATVNSAFSYSITGSNSPTSYAASGLPAGVSLNTSTGSITGTVTAAGSYPVTISATNGAGTSSATLTINVAPVAGPVLPVITSVAGTTAVAGSAFSYAVQASGSPTSYALGSLPPGLSFNAASGVLAGAPSAAGTYALAFSASNGAGTAQATVTLLVSATAKTPPVVTSPAGGIALLKEPFNYQVTTNPPATSFSDGNIPPGLTLNTATGQISGTPTSVGAFTVPIFATNASGTTQVTLTLPVVSPPFAVFTSPAAASAVVGQSFSTTLSTSGSNPSSSTASPLPAGLSVNATTGVISGTPTLAGSVSATTTQYTNAGTAVGKLLIAVAATAPTVPVVTSPAGAGAYTGVPFTYSVQATNSPSSFTASGLPPGLALNPSTGLISGTPTATGSYPVAVSALNANGVSGTATVTMIVGTPTTTARILSAASVAGVIGTPLSYTVITDSASFYGLSASNLPPGLSISGGTGVISGTPTTAGVYYTTLGIDNAYGAYSSTVITFRILVAQTDVPVLTGAAGAAGIVGVAFSYTVAANNGATSLGASSLPPGLSFDAATGLISGTPTASGTFSIPLTATNSVGQGSATLTLAVAAVSPVPPTLSTSNAVVDSYLVGGSVYNYIYATNLPAGTYSTADGTLQLAFTRDSERSDINYVVEASPDLSEWTPIASSTAGAPTVNLGGALSIVESTVAGTSQVSVVVEDGLPGSVSSQQFLRLRVAAP